MSVEDLTPAAGAPASRRSAAQDATPHALPLERAFGVADRSLNERRSSHASRPAASMSATSSACCTGARWRAGCRRRRRAAPRERRDAGRDAVRAGGVGRREDPPAGGDGTEGGLGTHRKPRQLVGKGQEATILGPGRPDRAVGGPLRARSGVPGAPNVASGRFPRVRRGFRVVPSPRRGLAVIPASRRPPRRSARRGGGRWRLPAPGCRRPRGWGRRRGSAAPRPPRSWLAPARQRLRAAPCPTTERESRMGHGQVKRDHGELDWAGSVAREGREPVGPARILVRHVRIRWSRVASLLDPRLR